jgi:diguanylate cyclase (GGDEF)-like protein
MREHQEELKEINAMLQNKTKKYELLASTDPLTGLYNRYKFEQLYNSSIQLMRQRKTYVSLIMLDIDYFKKVNDTFGHNIGDKVLRKVAKILLENVRNIDVVCRWGGEEFLILLPTVHQEGAIGIAEKIRHAIEQAPFSIVDHITASFGVSQINYDNSLEEVVAVVDKALYMAKSDGRNCVKVL